MIQTIESNLACFLKRLIFEMSLTMINNSDLVYMGQDLFTDDEIYEFNNFIKDINITCNKKIEIRNEKSKNIANLIGNRVLQNFEKNAKCCDTLFLYKARKRLFHYSEINTLYYYV